MAVLARNSTQRQQSKRIGVIAEDKSDVAVFEALTVKLIKSNFFSVKWFVGNGSGKLRHKCSAWARNLLAKGCEIIVVIHDLDHNEEADLRHKINGQIDAVPQEQCLVLIPIKEIEAWLLADPEAIQKTFNIKNMPGISAEPQTIQNPKDVLRRIVTNNSQTTYVNTIHNGELASVVSIDLVKERCPSFRPYPEFLKTVFTNRNDWVT